MARFTLGGKSQNGCDPGSNPGSPSKYFGRLEQKNCAVATDNRQGRKAAKINNLSFVGSIEIVVALFKNKKISFEKTMTALKILRITGWFDDYLIEKAMEDVKNERN